nr:histidine kinase dimerization/phospho-acceptor domain-containing protein [uncultured Draconibacterium sp.]
MNIEKYISDTYPVVTPYEGTNSVTPKLLEQCYLVVIDDQNKYCGILTPTDIIERPHKLVIDCIGKKECLSLNDTTLTAIKKFRDTHCSVLPVINEKKLVGVVDKNKILTNYESIINDLYNKSLISHKAKSLFIKNLSHEIRTPLNGVLGFIDIIVDLDTNNTEKKDISKLIKKSADRFLFIMDDLVELSLLDAGDNIALEKNNIIIDDIFQELKDYFSELVQLQNKPFTITISNPDLRQKIITDRKKLKHILFHLIDNAIKFSDDNNIVYGYKIEKENWIEFFVKNRSQQVPDEIKAKMFEFFEKQETVGKEINFGLGIGLSLVKKITEALGGEAKVEFIKDEIACYFSLPIDVA